MKIDLKLASKNRDIEIEIDKFLLEQIKKQPNRSYLGGSVLGKECDRELWYTYHQPVLNQDARIERIFHVGHLLESYVISLLKHSGYQVFHTNEEDDSQFGFKDEEIAGHIDGVIMLNNTPHLLEVKSANDKRFSEMQKKGIEISDPVYFGQVQVYMRKMDLEVALFVAINKNNCSLYFEVISLNKMYADNLISRGKAIARMKSEPDRKYKTKAFFKCKFCSYIEKCWERD